VKVTAARLQTTRNNQYSYMKFEAELLHVVVNVMIFESRDDDVRRREKDGDCSNYGEQSKND
jgi:hypothetical protein